MHGAYATTMFIATVIITIVLTCRSPSHYQSLKCAYFSQAPKLSVGPRRSIPTTVPTMAPKVTGAVAKAQRGEVLVVKKKILKFERKTKETETRERVTKETEIQCVAFPASPRVVPPKARPTVVLPKATGN